ncbi:tetratricopeptide repeat protein [Sulfuricurvum sp.]|uniref:tetratricopeptide repeat protein n=1 Tax=Sulfuricurvum sp. TaxID=2025608 RepID=UPI0035687358
MRYIAGLVLTGVLAIAAEIPQDGLKAEMAGKWNEAATMYENVLQKEPTRTDLYVRLSNIYAKEKQFDKAADVLNRAIAINPKQADLYDKLASIYAVLNQPELALAARDKTIVLEPKNITYLVAHAKVANWCKKSDIATESFKKALALDPTNEDLLFLLSQSSEWARKDVEAINYYQKYLDYNPDNLKIWLLLANMQVMRGDLAGSNETLKKAYNRFTPKSPIQPTSSTTIPDIAIPILEYHCLDKTAPNMYWVSTSEFESQMDELVKNGYHSITMDTIGKAIKEGKPLPEKPVAITFDDGCRNLYTQAFPILKKKGLNAEIYVVTDSIGNNDAERKSSTTAKLGENGENSFTDYLTWPEIKEMSDAGWGIGSHSRAHTDMNEINASARFHELLYSKLAILANTQLNVTSFSYPYGYGIGGTDIHNDLSSLGYTTAVASTGGIVQLKTTNMFEIPRIMIYGPKSSIDPQSKGISVISDPSRPNDGFIYKIEPNEAEKRYEKAKFLLSSRKESEALISINEAVRLSPNTVRYLKTQLQLAGVLNNASIAAEAATKLHALESIDENLLTLARTYVADNRLNDSVTKYAMYLHRHPDQKEVWLEYIQLQIWLGHYAAALEQLEWYKEKFGIDDPSLEIKAQALSWGNRQQYAFPILDSTLKSHPNDYNANYTKTVALDKNLQPIEAVENLNKVEASRPDATLQNDFLRKFITTKNRSSVTAGFQYYDDSYHVNDLSGRVNGEYVLTPITRLNAQIRVDDLQAKTISGYQQDNGKENARYSSATVGINHRFSPRLAFNGALGGAKTETSSDVIYTVGTLWSPVNAFSMNVSYGHDYFVISPRSISRDIKDNNVKMELHWEPTMKIAVDIFSKYDWLSDSNKRWEIDLSPKWLIARTQYWNLDIGPSARFYGYDKQFTDHGYYAPELIQGYYGTGYLYWKKNQNDGVGLVVSVGTIYDSYVNRSKPGGGATVEGTFGFYQDWMLKASVSLDYNSRFTDQSYRGNNFSLYVTRRF